MKNLKLLIISATTVFSLSGTVIAQDNRDQLAEIVVVANRIPVPLRQVATSISIINSEEIEAHGNSSLTDVLRQLPAIGVSRNGGAGTATSLRIRGEEGFRTLTLFDGLKLSDPSGTQVGPQLQHLLSTGIGRVEVLRGPQGLSYGADAGGVISISSQQSEEAFAAYIDVQGGSFGTNQLSAKVSGATEAVDFFLSASDYQTEGFNTRNSDRVLVDDDGYDNTTVHARLGFNPGENLRFELTHRNVEGETQFDGCFAGTTVHDCQSNYDLEATRLSVKYTAAGFVHSFAYSNTDTDRENFALGNSSFSAAGALERWEYIGTAAELNGFDVIFGFDLEQESNNAVDRDNEGYYLEILSDFSDSFFLSAGVRQDDNDDFGSHSSYRVSGAYLLDLGNSDTLKFKSSYGTGFRAPSPGEVAYNSGSFARPPASLVTLKEETSEGFELGVEYFSGNRNRLELVFFKQEVEDAIFFDLAAFSGYLQDIGRSVSKGYELSGEWSLSGRWQLNANYTHNKTEHPSGLQRRRRPEELANIGVLYRSLNDKLSVNAFYRISKDAIDERFGSSTRRFRSSGHYGKLCTPTPLRFMLDWRMLWMKAIRKSWTTIQPIGHLISVSG